MFVLFEKLNMTQSDESILMCLFLLSLFINILELFGRAMNQKSKLVVCQLVYCGVLHFPVELLLCGILAIIEVRDMCNLIF